MKADRNAVNQFSGEYMVQDSDHMSGITPSADNAKRGSQQVNQSQDETRQQGGGQKQPNDRRRQAH